MTIRTLADLAAAVRARRKELGLSQQALATRAGVSRLWVVKFEAGAPGAEVGRLLRLLGALDLYVSLVPRTDGAAPGPGPAGDLDALLDSYGEP